MSAAGHVVVIDSGSPFKPSQTTLQNVFNATVLDFGQHLQPVLCAFTTSADPQPKNVAFTVNSATNRNIDRPVRYLTVTNLCVHSIDKDHRVHALVSDGGCESFPREIAMPRYAHNKMPLDVKRRYFELIRSGMKGAAAARRVGVSTSCGSLWYLDAGSMNTPDRPISSRFFTQDDRIEIADGLNRHEAVKSIAARIGKSFQSVYREIARNSKPDGRYQPWFAHNQATVRRQRPKERRVAVDAELCRAIAQKLAKRWSPGQISRWLRRRWPKRKAWHVCHETIYEAVYLGLITVEIAQPLRTRRTYRHQRGRGRTREGAMRQLTNLKPISQRPKHVETRQQIGH